MSENSKDKAPTLSRWVLFVQAFGFIALGVILYFLCGKFFFCSACTPEHIVCSVCLTVVTCLFMILQTILTLKIVGYEFELKSDWIELQSEKNKANNTVNQPQVV